MSETITPSLLERVRHQDAAAWHRLVLLFTPVVYQWVRRGGVAEADAADVVQDPFVGVLHSVVEFRRDYDGATFRGWLRRITQHKVRDFFRRRADGPAAEGGSAANVRLQLHADLAPDDAAEETDETDSQSLVRRGLELIRDEFEPRTWQAFQAVGVDERPAAEVAAELGMSVGAVYVAKSRVLKRLREELNGLV
ncbi:MAG TPA: sigma-70 family RNA polymerase sigma factor [Urbifossiella sp.]|nr:sigma-70 family RNA polymerase sigma factor [Urbifossiella sp.]